MIRRTSMSTEQWEYFCAIRIYESLLSQGKYCPEESLDKAKLNLSLAGTRLYERARRDRKMRAILKLVAGLAWLFVIAILIYSIW